MAGHKMMTKGMPVKMRGMTKGGTMKKMKMPTGMTKGGTIKKPMGMTKGGTIKKPMSMKKGGNVGVRKPSSKNSGLYGR